MCGQYTHYANSLKSGGKEFRGSLCIYRPGKAYNNMLFAKLFETIENSEIRKYIKRL